MDAAMGLLVEHPELPIGEMVTHRFKLEEWRLAMRTALGRGRSGAIKVAFEPQPRVGRMLEDPSDAEVIPSHG